MDMRIAALLLLASAFAGADVLPTGSRLDARRLAELASHPAPGSWLPAPGGRWIALQKGDEAVTVLDAQTGKEIGDIPGPGDEGIHDGGWSSSGRFLAVAFYDRTVKVYEIPSLKEVASFEPHPGYT